jgi:hypothetical protein
MTASSIPFPWFLSVSDILRAKNQEKAKSSDQANTRKLVLLVLLVYVVLHALVPMTQVMHSVGFSAALADSLRSANQPPSQASKRGISMLSYPKCF